MNKLKNLTCILAILAVFNLIQLGMSKLHKISANIKNNQKTIEDYLKSNEIDVEIKKNESFMKSSQVNLSIYERSYFTIRNRQSNKCLSKVGFQGTRLAQMECNSNDYNQLFHMTILSSNNVILHNYYNNFAITVIGDEVKLWEYESNYGNQILTLTQEGLSNSFVITNRLDGSLFQIDFTLIRCLDNNSKTDKLATINGKTCTRALNQQYLLEIRNNPTSTIDVNNIFNIRTNKNLCIRYNGVERIFTQEMCGTTDNFKFFLQKNIEGTFLITPIANKSVTFDVKSKSENNGANIHAWQIHRGINQRFLILPYDSSTGFYIRDMNSGLCMDDSGSSSTGTETKIWTCGANNSNQRFTFNIVGSQTLPFIDTTKFYRIRSVNFEQKIKRTCMNLTKSIGRIIERSECADIDNSQLWKFERVSSTLPNVFVITNFMANLSLDVINFEKAPYNAIIGFDTTRAINQQFQAIPIGNNSFMLKSIYSQKCLQFPAESDVGNVGLEQVDCWSFYGQQFEIVLGTPNTLIQPFKPYYIRNKGSGKCMKHTGVDQYVTEQDCDGSLDIKFSFVKCQLDACYQISPYGVPNGVLSTFGFFAQDQNGLAIYTSTDNQYGLYQKVYIYSYDSNSFYIRDENLEGCYDNKGGYQTYHTWECSDGNINQSFEIIESFENPLHKIDLGTIQIRNASTNKCLSVNNMVSFTSSQVPCNPLDLTQRFVIERNGDTDRLKSKYFDVYLTFNTSGFVFFEQNGENSNFLIRPSDGTNVLTSSTNFHFRLASDPLKVLAFSTSTNFSIPIISNFTSSSLLQQWKLETVTEFEIPRIYDFLYNIKNNSNGNCISLNNSSQTCLNNRNALIRFTGYPLGLIIQYEVDSRLIYPNISNNSLSVITGGWEAFDAQFLLIGFDEFSFYIKHYNSNKCLGLSGSSLWLYDCNSSNATLGWKIERVDEKINEIKASGSCI